MIRLATRDSAQFTPKSGTATPACSDLTSKIVYPDFRMRHELSSLSGMLGPITDLKAGLQPIHCCGHRITSKFALFAQGHLIHQQRRFALFGPIAKLQVNHCFSSGLDSDIDCDVSVPFVGDTFLIQIRNSSRQVQKEIYDKAAVKPCDLDR